MSKVAERAGKPDVGELVRQGRLKYNATRGLDPNPNPAIGQVPNPENGMRAGMSPEKYHKLVLLSERKRRLGKEWDFVPELEDHEFEIYLAWLKSGGPKKMRAAGRDVARAQTQDVMSLIKKYDPENAAKLTAIPAHPSAQVRDAIGSSSFSEELEEAADEAEVPEASAEDPEPEILDASGEEEEGEEEEGADLAPEAQVQNPDVPEGYDSVDADAEEPAPQVVSAPKKRGRGPNKKK